MRFVHPELLWLLLLLPLFGLIAWWSAGRRRRAIERFAGGREFAERFTGEVSGHRRAAKTLLLLFALAASCIAAARPQWGTRMEAVTQQGIDVVIVLDTSLSMAAEDLTPSRLGQARHELDSLVSRLAGNRIALVTFAGQATLACPLTLDHSAVQLFLDAIDIESVSVPGTALADALRLALRTFRIDERGADDRGRAIVLFSDGEDHEGGIDEIAAALKSRGISIFSVGCGTTRGTPIPVKNNAGRASGGYKKDREGKVVTTRLDETALEQLALETGGRYYRATPAEVEVEEISAALSAMDAHEFGSVLRTRYEERFQLPLALALFALVGEALLGDRRKRLLDEELG